MTASSEPIRRALVSVSDKTGLLDFARRLAALGVEIISTGGTAQALRGAGLAVTEVSQFTGFPEMLDGRVKTLHPKVHGGLLFLRDNPLHRSAMESQGLVPIDLVVVNLYPFRQTIEKPGVTFEEAIEQIDIGGPSMLRSAAKNHRWVTVVSQPEQYAEVIAEMERLGGATGFDLRRRLAHQVFQSTAEYDRLIAAYLGRSPAGEAPPACAVELPGFPERLLLDLKKTADLRYGENPHQKAALFQEGKAGFEEWFEKLHGKEVSYNNILDLTAAEELVEEFFEEPAAVAIIKHTNPCGVGLGSTVAEAWGKALACDPDAASGGIVAVNRPLDLEGAEAVDSIFTEIVIAPGFSPDALHLLRGKKNRILLRSKRPLREPVTPQFRSVGCGVLVQWPDFADLGGEHRVVTRREPGGRELEALRFAWKVVKHVKSNAIVLAAPDRTLGIGAGQMSRVDAARLAVDKARRAGLDLRGSAAASDAFFPFPDGLIACAEAGATAVIEPGGSKRDAEVISAADERGVAMVFTGVRHFRH